MVKKKYHIIGVMSGTSLDGVDLAEIFFTKLDSDWSFTLGKCSTIPYSEDWVGKLKGAISYSKSKLIELNLEYTFLLGNIMNQFIHENQLVNIDAICSHGHTILHNPTEGYTLQIGNLPEIVKITKHKVVCDFRIQDVKLGGQGAPLVPIGDQILFSNYDYCINLGGFSNISYEYNSSRIAYDISPVNTVLNFYANRLGFEFDESGNLAKKGLVNDVLLVELNSNPYFNACYPKSLGVEFVYKYVFPVIEKYNLNELDVLATYTEHIAQQISKVLIKPNATVLITGGGAYNSYLIERLHNYKSEVKITIPDAKLLEFKEALIFGLLGVLRLEDEINVLSSVTGAKQDHSSGVIFE